MLKWAAVFLVVAIVAAILGFGFALGAMAALIRLLFWIFVILAVVMFIVGFAKGRKIAS
jgi:uncharacterized membrane protein YtjA (UPF0391 family)